MTVIRIAIVGDFNPKNQSHVATDDAVSHCSVALSLPVESHWVATEDLAQTDGITKLAEFRGFWIAPGSPYKSVDGALSAIRMARERRYPLLGTCGGFQHLILEYARNVMGFPEAKHEETHPLAPQRFISRLACSLVGRTMSITLQPGSLVARCYGQTRIQEQYRCNFGVNPEYVDVLCSSALQIVGSDDEGVVRVVELAGHPFFVGTLFVPQLTSTPSVPHPLVSAFIKACSEAIEIRRGDLDLPVAAALISALNAELSTRYPEEGANHFRLAAEEVTAGRGAFLIAYADGKPLGCGAIRQLDAGTAEIKRMFVAPDARRRGVGRAILVALEAEGRGLRVQRIVLETGERQPEALALYTRAGFERIPAFGEYVGSPLSVCMGKRLVP